MSEKENLRKKLHQLGYEIRQRGSEIPVRHGSHWRLNLPNGSWFYHDDYNNSVTAHFTDGKEIHFGIDFGGFETRREESDFDNAINAIVLSNYNTE